MNFPKPNGRNWPRQRCQMELDIPCGTLCSYAEASSLLSSKAGHLLTVSSLTAALRASGKDFSVEPVYLGLTNCAENGDEIFVRDVLLKLDGETVIQARSACRPDSSLWTELLDCGTQPLGERLFDGTLPLKRSDFEFLRFEDSDYPSFRRPVTARRSYFDWNGETLELTEYFLLKLIDLYR